MSVLSGVGSVLYVSASEPATKNAAGFAALTYTEVGEVTDFGSAGKVYSTVNHTPIKTGQEIPFKTTYSNGSRSISYASVDSDDGQLIMKNAVNSRLPVSFKIVLPDGRIRFFAALVLSEPETVTTDIVSISADLALTTDIINVAAASTVTLEYAAGAGGYIVGDTTQVIPNGADGTTVFAAAMPGFSFVGWSDSVATASRKDLNVVSNLSVVANFVAD